MDYLYDLAFLTALHEQKQLTHYARIEILNPYDGWHDGECIEGQITQGSLTVNGNSAVRRAGSLTMVATMQNYKISDTDNIISINKEIKLAIGLENKINSEYPDMIWLPLGQFVITGASITRNLSTWTINISFKDYMVLVNGECGGIIPTSLVHSPIEVFDNGKTRKEPAQIASIIETLLLTYTPIPKERIFINLKGTNKSVIQESSLEYYLRNTARWIGADKIYSIPQQINDNLTVYHLTPTIGDNEIANIYNFNDDIGYQITEFTYPANSELISNAGESVASVLDKIKNTCGNFEYFFDVNGNFYFQEINNGINQGSAEINLTEAIADQYLPFRENIEVLHSFTDDALVSSYTNNPMYNGVKNDFVVWSLPKNSSTALLYHLIVDYIPQIPNGRVIFNDIKWYIDDFGNKRVWPSTSALSSDIEYYTTSIAVTDWRHYVYMNSLINGVDTFYSAELIEFWPKVFDVVLGDFKVALAQSEEARKLQLNNMSYFLDILDPAEIKDNPVARKALADIIITKIGRRTKTLSNNDINTLFTPTFPDICYIELGNSNTAKQREQAIENNWPFIQVPKYLAENIEIGTVYYAAYDALRTVLHESLNLNNTIQIQALPLYYLDVNKGVQVIDKDTDINGNYWITSLSIPLDASKQMSLSATKIIQRI